MPTDTAGRPFVYLYLRRKFKSTQIRFVTYLLLINLCRFDSVRYDFPTTFDLK